MEQLHWSMPYYGRYFLWMYRRYSNIRDSEGKCYCFYWKSSLYEHRGFIKLCKMNLNLFLVDWLIPSWSLAASLISIGLLVTLFKLYSYQRLPFIFFENSVIAGGNKSFLNNYVRAYKVEVCFFSECYRRAVLPWLGWTYFKARNL